MMKVAILILIVLMIVAFVKLRPRLRQQRHEAWRRAGLLPEQVDPARHRDERDSQ
ncbi:hypothetical protein [Demetria terragena]|uniref:hypothetical protein n=1 Tax=Demetria terragena TaxID=63959 RepID=UPI00037FB558|nr:hypothetical protein [Demetria terragena]